VTDERMTAMQKTNEKLIVDAGVFIDAFDSESPSREESIDFLSKIAASGKIITMPAHGLFEIKCAFKKLLTLKNNFSGPNILDKMNHQIEIIHIDEAFINRYIGVDIPYIKAGDHIYIVVAKDNGYTVVTRDNTFTNRALEAGVKVLSPKEYIDSL
jgi:predicted nucleic acid-binding protein